MLMGGACAKAYGWSPKKGSCSLAGGRLQWSDIEP
jgi:hypothetical protein